MKPFITIARPHKDILEGRLTMDIFAADLWEVFKGRAPDEYKDPNVFFRKTYITEGLKNLLEIAEKRLRGGGGDPVIQIQTPFGGGKTHSLIALYHKAKEWGVKLIVFCGDKFPADKDAPTLWEEMETQLEGKARNLAGKVPPGGEKLRNFLINHQPLLILLDEIHEYMVKASGVKVGDSNLSTQTLVFLQELTGVVKTLDKTILFASLPSSDPYKNEKSEELLRALQSILGRMEKVYTPVQDEEISHVIRRRLFSEVDEKEARETIEKFLDYAEKEKIFPEGMEKSRYREKFIKSFPFQPEVIDVLYKRWGSYPAFQRTRGVLRILALVVHSLKDSQNPFIRLGDFDLKNEEIKRELIKLAGQEYNSIIAADITSPDAGSKKVDRSLGDAYLPFSFGTKVATAIFMYSFSGGPQKGATLNEIKLSTAEPSAPSSIIAEAVSKLKENLFYLSHEGLYFTNEPNLNLLLLMKMEGIEEIKSEEKNLLTRHLTGRYFALHIWPANSKDIPDTKNLKLVVLKKREQRSEFLEYCGEKPRVYRNTLIFLSPSESERINFENFLKKKLAWELIEKDKTLNLTEHQKKEIREKIKKAEDEAKERIRSLYRLVSLPLKEGFEEIDLGIPTYGADMRIDKEIYERLKQDGKILEKLSPLILQEKYLKDKNYVETKNILDSFFKTPGEIRIVREEVLKNSIKEGVVQGLFGIGSIESGKPVCHHFRKECSPKMVEGEIIIRKDLCLPGPEERISDEKLQSFITKIEESETIEDIQKIKEIALREGVSEEGIKKLETVIRKREDELKGIVGQEEKYHRIYLKLDVPPGKLADLSRMVFAVKSRFNQVNIKVELSLHDGEMRASEYENIVRETINQSEIKIEEEEVK